MKTRRRNAISALTAAVIGLAMPGGAGRAQQPDIPVMVRADGDWDTCALGQVSGLNPKGDNFLAVRSGPGSSYKMIDKLHTGDRVWMFDRKGDWIGVAYGAAEIECSPIKKDKAYDGPGRPGWVHKKFVTLLAG